MPSEMDRLKVVCESLGGMNDELWRIEHSYDPNNLDSLRKRWGLSAILCLFYQFIVSFLWSLCWTLSHISHNNCFCFSMSIVKSKFIMWSNSMCKMPSKVRKLDILHLDLWTFHLHHIEKTLLKSHEDFFRGTMKLYSGCILLIVILPPLNLTQASIPPGHLT